MLMIKQQNKSGLGTVVNSIIQETGEHKHMLAMNMAQFGKQLIIRKRMLQILYIYISTDK